MGALVDGIWQDREQGAGAGGRFVRREAAFRNWVTADGAAGASGEGGFRGGDPAAITSMSRSRVPGRTAR